MTHIDDWLDLPTLHTNPGEVYARWWFEFARMPAWKKHQYAALMREHRLFCSYRGERYRVTGASRLGDVWLAKDFTRDVGYDLRVAVDDCSKWHSEPEVPETANPVILNEDEKEA